MSRTLTEIRSLARSHTRMAFNSLVTIADRGKSEAARVAAAEAILNRGWGKAEGTLTLEAGETLLEIITRAARSGLERRTLELIPDRIRDGDAGGQPGQVAGPSSERPSDGAESSDPVGARGGEDGPTGVGDPVVDDYEGAVQGSGDSGRRESAKGYRLA